MHSTRHLIAVVAGVLVLLVGCGGDDDASDPTVPVTTTTADDGDTAASEDDGDEGDPGPADPDPTTTTSPNLTPAEGPLVDRLVDPAVVEGFSPDDAFGDGSLDGDLCEDVTIESTWDDEASLALSDGHATAPATFQEAVLAFADEQAASDFVDAVVAAHQECTLSPTVTSLDGVGDAAERVDVEGPPAQTVVVVRVGATVAHATAIGGADGGGTIPDEVITAVADALIA